jgi:hypothetical protein
MSFSWQEFAELAIQLASELQDEASQRTAINRSYYAAYHAASALVRDRDLHPPDQPLSHWLVWKLIRDSHLPNCQEISQRGFTLRDARVWADYWNPFPGELGSQVEKALVNSAAIIALLRET